MSKVNFVLGIITGAAAAMSMYLAVKNRKAKGKKKSVEKVVWKASDYEASKANSEAKPEDTPEEQTVAEETKKEQSTEKHEGKMSKTERKEAIKKVSDIVQKNKYQGQETASPKIYVIPPEEYGETGYEQKELIYYANKRLVDEDDNIVLDIEHTIGNDALNHFGEYEPDSVYVRNDRTETDYIILSDYHNWTKKGR